MRIRDFEAQAEYLVHVYIGRQELVLYLPVMLQLGRKLGATLLTQPPGLFFFADGAGQGEL